MSPTIEKAPATKARVSHSKPNIAVVFTSIESTLSALRKAGALASGMQAGITLVVPQVVPYPLPVHCPTVSSEFNERRFRVLADESPVETTVRICLCRDRLEALRQVLKPLSLVVIGGSRRWWPTAEARLARQLRRSGYQVVFSEA